MGVEMENLEMNLSVNEVLPKDLIEILSISEGKEGKIISSARTDMNKDGEYCNGYLILSSKNIIIALLPVDQEAVKYFGGYTDEKLKDLELKDSDRKKRDWNIIKIGHGDITSLEVLMLVSGGVIFGNIDGVDQKLLSFTNSCIGDMKSLVKDYEKFKKNEEITRDDVEKKEEEHCPKCGGRYPNRDRQICPKCMDKHSVFIRTLSYFKPYWLKIIIMILCTIATAGLNLFWPYLNGTILYDRVLARDEQFLQLFNFAGGRFTILLLGVVLTMFLSKLTAQIFGMIQTVINAKIVPEVVKDIKSDVFKSMGKLSVSFYNKRQTGGLMTRVLDDTDHVAGFYFDGLPFLFVNGLSIIFICIMMISMNWVLALCSLILLPFLTIISIKMLPRLWSHYGRRYRASRSLNSQVNDNITGARVVKAFGQEDSERKRFKTYNHRVKQAELSLVGFDNRYTALYTIVNDLTTFVVWGVGSAFVLSKTNMSLGVLITFVGYISQLKGPLDFMSHIFRWWTETVNRAQRIFEIIDSVPEVEESKNPVSLKQMKGIITLKDVTFGYEPHKPVLKNISFHVDEGKMLGIVGRSGAGKSTLVNLISRLYDPGEGEILIDGINIRDIAFKDLYNNIAMVSQETYIFMGTVGENIAYAKPNASREEIIKAAVYASAHDFICKMPDGYDTVIGSAGRDLSGGERQRLSIARAILANPKILILDEATASVDTETEQAIQHSLSYLVRGRTTLSIAHRLSTLKDADSLVVIDDGKITESGTHRELIEEEGTYYKLMELQTKALALKGIE